MKGWKSKEEIKRDGMVMKERKTKGMLSKWRDKGKRLGWMGDKMDWLEKGEKKKGRLRK